MILYYKVLYLAAACDRFSPRYDPKHARKRIVEDAAPADGLNAHAVL